MAIISGIGPNGRPIPVSVSPEGALEVSTEFEATDPSEPIWALVRELVTLRLGMMKTGMCKAVSKADVDSELAKYL